MSNPKVRNQAALDIATKFLQEMRRRGIDRREMLNLITLAEHNLIVEPVRMGPTINGTVERLEAADDARMSYP